MTSEGAVHASVSSTSTAGTEMLRRELPSLTTYLHQEQVSVTSVAVHAAAGAQDLSNMAGGFDDGARHQQQQGDAPAGRGQQETGSPHREAEGSWTGGGEVKTTADWLPRSASIGSGGWLSVRA
jgi:hypothetical protein